MTDEQVELFYEGFVRAMTEDEPSVRCQHDRLNEDGICRQCGEDCRGGSV